MKLGIIVVYLLKENGGPLLQLHLDRIARHTGVPYTIYGAPLRLLPQFRAVLEARPQVKLVDIPPIEQRHVGREHSYYLDRLVQAAIGDGATHICALHVDSFPIRDGWAEDLIGRLNEQWVGAALLAEETGDRILPMPAAFVFTREFQQRCQPRFYPPPEIEASEHYQQFLKTYDENDSGIGYAYEMHRHGLKCHYLRRSNKRNEHYVIGGIYGDTFFHLGAANRKRHRMRGDHSGQGATFTLRLRTAIDQSQRLPGLVKAALQRLLPDRNALLDRAEAHNRECQVRVFNRLLADPDGYIDWLRGGKRR